MVELETPTVARLGGKLAGMAPALRKALTFTDKRVDFELRKAQASLRRFRREDVAASLKSPDSWGEEKYDRVVADLEDRVEALKLERRKCLLTEDERGLSTYSGFGRRLAQAAGVPLVRRYDLPEPRPLPWANLPRNPDRPYQVEAHDLLLAAAPEGPAGIELPTGSGKSTVIRNLVKTLGLGTVVMAPSTSIAGQLHDDLVHAFGKRYVGLYGDGKKQHDRLVVVGIDDSLTRVQPGSQAWDNLSRKPVFFADESHLTPAESLRKVCFGLMAAAPYRFFVSATQMRNDGLDLVLDGITGKIVLRKTLRELVEAGWLARPTFKFLRIRTDSSYRSEDANRMTRAHLYYNPLVSRAVAEVANKFVELMRRPTIVLVEELEQFRELLPHLRHRVAFAHGPLDRRSRELVPEQFRDDKPKALVEAFNRGDLPVLVGTSCIATGTDVQVAEAGIYVMGGRSEIKVMQALGRETRGGFNGVVRNPWTGNRKDTCVHVDVDVVDQDLLGQDAYESFVTHRHAAERAAYYEKVWGRPDVVDMTRMM